VAGLFGVHSELSILLTIKQAVTADHELGRELFEKISGWLQDGSLRSNTSKVLLGGLGAVKEGFQMHRDGKISGFKLVYEL
jgi:hypothetical protein